MDGTRSVPATLTAALRPEESGEDHALPRCPRRTPKLAHAVCYNLSFTVANLGSPVGSSFTTSVFISIAPSLPIVSARSSRNRPAGRRGSTGRRNCRGCKRSACRGTNRPSAGRAEGADHGVGPGVDHLPRELDLVLLRRGRVLAAPVQEGDHRVGPVALHRAARMSASTLSSTSQAVPGVLGPAA